MIKQLWHWLFHSKNDLIRVNNEGYSWVRCIKCSWESKGIIITDKFDSKKAS